MEKHIDGLEQQLVELRNLIITHNRSRSGTPHKKHSHKLQNVNDVVDGVMWRVKTACVLPHKEVVTIQRGISRDVSSRYPYFMVMMLMDGSFKLNDTSIEHGAQRRKA